MTMHNPPHPGDFILETYVKPFSISARGLAKHLDVAPSTLNRLINGNGSVSPEMAYRLSIVLGRSPESWLAMQARYDLWRTQKSRKFSRCKPVDFSKIDDAA